MSREHGTYAKYKLDNCRCYPCAAKASEYNVNRERAIAYGTWQPFVPAEPVRAHVLVLRDCGIGSRTLAQLADVDRKVIQNLVNGKSGCAPPRRIRPDKAARILAVEPSLENVAPSTPVDSTGTHRRIRALVASGWSMAKIGARLGVTPSNFGSLMAAGQVTAATARSVRELYDELWDQAPPESEHRQKIAANRARNYARARGWFPPMAWDDDTIDDPASRPSTGEKATRDQALAEDAEELIRSQGYTTELAAARLGVSVSYLNKAISRSRRKEVAA